MAGQTEHENPALQRSIADLMAAVDAEIDGAIDRLRRTAPRGAASELEVGHRSEAGARNRLDSLMRRLEDRMRDATDRPDV